MGKLFDSTKQYTMASPVGKIEEMCEINSS